jgi:hypothetical protein
MPHPYLILLDLIILIIHGKEYKSRSSSLCSFLHPLVTLSLLGTNIPLSTLFSNTLSLCSSLKPETKFHTNSVTPGKTIALNILTSMILYSRREDKGFWAV